MTSLLRELLPVPNVADASNTITSRPLRAISLATASPTTPAPIMTVSTLYKHNPCLRYVGPLNGPYRTQHTEAIVSHFDKSGP